MQFMPADMAGRPRRGRHGLLIAVPFKEVESCALRIGEDTEAADPWNILWSAVDRAAGRLAARGVRVDVVDRST